MKIPKLQYRQIIEIDWLDSCHQSGWLSESSVNNSIRDVSHRSIGYYLSEDKQQITFVQSYQNFGKKEDDRKVDAIMQIPKCAITKIRILK